MMVVNLSPVGFIFLGITDPMRLKLIKRGVFWQACDSSNKVYKQSMTKRYIIDFINAYASQNKDIKFSVKII